MKFLYNEESYLYEFNIGTDGSALTVEVFLKDPYGTITSYSPSTDDATTGDYYYQFVDELTFEDYTSKQFSIWWNYTDGTTVTVGDPEIIIVQELGSNIVSRDFVKSWLGITGTTLDNKIDILIPAVEADYLNIRNCPFDRDFDNNIIYPQGSDITAANMIGFKLDSIGSIGDVTAERIGTYSVSYASSSISSFGYPTSIINSIKRYIRGF